MADDLDTLLYPDYQDSDIDEIKEDTSVGTEPTQFTLNMPEDNVANSPTIPVAISEDDSDADDEQDNINNNLFRQPISGEFVYGQSQMEGTLGVYSSDLGIVIGQVSLPITGAISESTQSVQGMYGQRWLGNNYGGKQFTIPCYITTNDTDPLAYADIIANIGKALISNDNTEQPFVIGDYPDLTFYGHFSAIDTPAFTDNAWNSTFNLTFTASDPRGFYDTESLDISSTPYGFTPKGLAPTPPIIQMAFTKDTKSFSYSTTNGQVFVGYSDDDVVDTKPVIYRDGFDDLGTLTQVKDMSTKGYSLANADVSSNATGKVTDTGEAITVDKYYKDAEFNFTNKTKAYGLLLETGTFSTKVSSGNAWRLNTRLWHEKYYSRAYQRIEAYLIDENGKRLGRFGISDEADGSAPKVYILFGDSLAKETSNLKNGYGYSGHGNTTYAKKKVNNANNQTKTIKYTQKPTTNSSYLGFSQKINRTVTTTVYSRELTAKQADNTKKVLYGQKQVTVKSETAEIGFKYINGKIDKTSKGNAYLYDASNGNRLKWVVKPKGSSKGIGDYVTTADFDTITRTENDDDKMNDIVEATSLGWTVTSNSTKKTEVPLNKIKETTKKVKKKKKTTITSTAINYTATRKVHYAHKYYNATGNGKGVLTIKKYDTNYEANNATGKGWKRIGKTSVSVTSDNDATRSKIKTYTIADKSVVKTASDYHNSDALSKGFYGFDLKYFDNKLTIRVYRVNEKTAREIPNTEILKKTFKLGSSITLNLAQLAYFFGKTPIMEDKLDANNKVAKSYTNDYLSISNLTVYKLLSDDDVDTPRVIAHSGDVATIDVESENVYINGQLANELVAVNSNFPQLNGGKAETIAITPNPSTMNITLAYRPSVY